MKYETLEDAAAAGAAPWDLEVKGMSDFHVKVFQDRYPVTNGHLLFVPKYNTLGCIKDAFEFAMFTGDRMVKDQECDAYNIGINQGVAAGQTIMYPHIHLIPRKHGDSANPIGGVRGVILGQANYKSSSYQQPV